ncbi:hypothetical protein KA089_01790 [Candidatus Woesebacteria bacterium]|nr:hypothetical protein [Candidatus Woesebacteria bacterium]
MKLSVENKIKRDRYWKYYWISFILICVSSIIFLITSYTLVNDLTYTLILLFFGIILVILGVISYTTKYYVVQKFISPIGSTIHVAKEKGVFDKEAEVLAIKQIIFGIVLIILGVFLNLYF